MTAKPEAEALLPCPFCNGAAEIVTGPLAERFGGRCTSCGVWRDDRATSKLGAAYAWNTRAAQPVEVTPDDEALNVHRFSFDGRAIEVDGEYEFVKASEVRRRIAELQYAVAVWRGKAEMRGREGAQARAALAEVRDKTIEECAAIATARRNQWSCAGGFGGHSAGARIIQDEILALKDKETTNG